MPRTISRHQDERWHLARDANPKRIRLLVPFARSVACIDVCLWQPRSIELASQWNYIFASLSLSLSFLPKSPHMPKGIPNGHNDSRNRRRGLYSRRANETNKYKDTRYNPTNVVFDVILVFLCIQNSRANSINREENHQMQMSRAITWSCTRALTLRGNTVASICRSKSIAVTRIIKMLYNILEIFCTFVYIFR